MARTVKITEDTNDKLDRLKARLLLRTGEKLSKQEILERLVRIGLSDDSLLLRRRPRIRYPIPLQGVEEGLGQGPGSRGRDS